LFHFGEGDLVRDESVEEDAADGRVDQPAVPAGHRRHADLHARLELDLALVVGDAHLVEAGEDACPALGNPASRAS